MADKPSRALVIYGDGFAPFISSSHSHLHSLATRASCGFLSVRNSSPLSGLETSDLLWSMQYMTPSKSIYSLFVFLSFPSSPEE
ncbi:hypothetical protein ACLOJK_035515 [Asimina triloba]